MHSLNQWKPESATGARNGTRKNNQAQALVGFAVSRLFVVLAIMGLAGLFAQGRALAQAQAPTVTVSPSVSSFVEGDLNPITGTVALNAAAGSLMGNATVNITFRYQTPMAGDTSTSTAVVFVPGEENQAKAFALNVGNDTVSVNPRPVSITATVNGPGAFNGITNTATISQIDPHGIFLTEVAAKTSESDAVNGSRTFLDVSLVDPNNPWRTCPKSCQKVTYSLLCVWLCPTATNFQMRL